MPPQIKKLPEKALRPQKLDQNLTFGGLRFYQQSFYFYFSFLLFISLLLLRRLLHSTDEFFGTDLAGGQFNKVFF